MRVAFGFSGLTSFFGSYVLELIFLRVWYCSSIQAASGYIRGFWHFLGVPVIVSGTVVLPPTSFHGGHLMLSLHFLQTFWLLCRREDRLCLSISEFLFCIFQLSAAGGPRMLAIHQRSTVLVLTMGSM